MTFTRGIYWNVGNGASTLFPMYLVATIAIAICLYGLWRRVQIYRLGKDLGRFDNRSERIISAVKNIFLQKRVMETASGVMHGYFFWGFLLLFIGTCLIFLQADITEPLFGFRFLEGTFYKLFSLILDLAGFLAICMLTGLMVRRYILRPEGLETRTDDLIIHILLMTILITGFFIEGSRMAVTELGTSDAYWSPIGLLFAKALSGSAVETLLGLHAALWWFHLVIAAVFIALIPFLKLRHMVTTAANYLFVDPRPVGSLNSVDLEDEEAEQFGVASLSDFTWKDVFDTDACTLCKRCQDRCPAYATDKPLSPMKIINQMQDIAFGKTVDGLIDTVTEDALWACTTCRACQEICPATIEHVNKIVDMRRNLVLMEGKFPGDEVMKAVDQVEVNGNPLGMGISGRADWMKDLDVTIMSESKDSAEGGADVDILYFVGCYASFDKRNQQVAKSFIALCNAAGIRVGMLGNEEKCCGEPVRKIGNEYVYRMVADENIETISKYGVSKIVTTCPHCFQTLSKDYAELGLKAEVEHHTTFLDRLVSDGTLKLNTKEFACTYHDSCYLGRYNDNVIAPRRLIYAAGGRMVEMDKREKESFCCGGGGGRILAEENLGSRINVKRVAMAVETGMPNLVSNCPFCLTMFEDGVKSGESEGDLKPLDIAEILVERIKR